MGSILYSSKAFHEHPFTEGEDTYVNTMIDHGQIHIGYFPAPKSGSKLILYSCGNLEYLHRIYPRLAEMALGFNVAIIAYDYPGYGASVGHSNEATVNETVLTVYDWVKQWMTMYTQIYAWGRSVGGAPTTYLATQRPVAGVILESAFTSAWRYYQNNTKESMLSEFTLDFMNNLRRIQQKGDRWHFITIIHGATDEEIPIFHAEAMYAAARTIPSLRVFFHRIEEHGHNTITASVLLKTLSDDYFYFLS